MALMVPNFYRWRELKIGYQLHPHEGWRVTAMCLALHNESKSISRTEPIKSQVPVSINCKAMEATSEDR
jgi:hypothetical protein